MSQKISKFARHFNPTSKMNKQAAKPFLKWAGGKGQLLTTLEPLLPPRIAEMENLTYIEPFIGGGAMLFFMLQKFGNIRKAVINDLNPNLCRAYATVKETPERLIRRLAEIQKEYYSIAAEEDRKEFYLSARKRFNEGGLSDVDNTSYLIFLNRTCFNGLYRVNSKGLFNVPFGRYKSPKICDEDTILADSELLQNVEITCGDFELTGKYASGNAFVYLDPPYRPLDATSSFNSYAKEEFGDNEQIRLKKFFDRLTAVGCPAMLSNSDGKGRNPDDTFFDDLYDSYSIMRVYASRSVNANPDKRGKLTELLIRNYTGNGEAAANGAELIKLIPDIKDYGQSSYRKTV